MFLLSLLACTASFTSTLPAQEELRNLSGAQACLMQSEIEAYQRDALSKKHRCYLEAQLVGELATQFTEACNTAFEECMATEDERLDFVCEELGAGYPLTCEYTVGALAGCTTSALAERRKQAKLECGTPPQQWVDPEVDEVCADLNSVCSFEEVIPVENCFIPGDEDKNGTADCDDPACDCDADGDGFVSTDFGGVDCDDNSAENYPGADEVCDDVDNDCDGRIDDADPDLIPSNVYYLDNDGDGWGGELEILACQLPEGALENGGDCDDNNADIAPGELEVCDGVDNDCNGLTDDEDPDVDTSTQFESYVDADGDGYGSGPLVLTCRPADNATNNLDCDDSDPSVRPGQEEVRCDGADNDCNPDTIDTPPADMDGDGFTFCEGDCDDNEPTAFPGATEVICNGVDEDCDFANTPDDADLDNDGFGSCFDDCDDNDPLASVVQGWRRDNDGDGAGRGQLSEPSCHPPGPGYAGASLGLDCDDSDPRRAPFLEDICDDGIDQDCSGTDFRCTPDPQFNISLGAEVDYDLVADEASGVFSQKFIGTSGQNLCWLSQDVLDWDSDPLNAGAPDPFTAPCTDGDGNACDFNFTMTLRNASTSFDYCALLGVNASLVSDSTSGWGYHSDYLYGGNSYGPAFMYYFTGYGWYALDTSFNNNTNTDQLSWSYEFPGTYLTP